MERRPAYPTWLEELCTRLSNKPRQMEDLGKMRTEMVGGSQPSRAGVLKYLSLNFDLSNDMGFTPQQDRRSRKHSSKV